MNDYSLQNNTVYVWLAHLNHFYDNLDELRSLLSETERQKADRFHFERHQKRYTVSQAVLRTLLGNYTKQDPKLIEFEKSKYGKPYLKNSDIKFNISHSNEYAIYAFALHDELGIDLEHWRDRKHLDGIIDSNFSEVEQQLYHALPHELKVAGFYQGWTCNEAYIKAIGMGLSYPLKDFSVEMDPRKPVNLLDAVPRTDVETDWVLHRLNCPEEYSAALATRTKVNLKINVVKFSSL